MNYGGQFLVNGWKATTTNSQLFIILPADLPQEGTMSVKVSNFNPVTQCSSDKHQIINLYSQSNGSKDIFDTPGSWVNIRTGTAYSLGAGLAGYKMLAAFDGERKEDRYIENATWNIGQTYEFKIVWDDSHVWTFAKDELQGELVMTGDMIEKFRFIFLGKDNVYSGQAGPVYTDLRIYARDDYTPPSTNLSFTDITHAAGVVGNKSLQTQYSPPEDVSTFGHGVSFGDFNRDGRYDLVYSNAGILAMDDVMFMNQGNNEFRDVTQENGVTDYGHTHGVISADFDNDGDLDLFYTNQPVALDGEASGRNRLYRNDGNGVFTEITNYAGISTEESYSRGGVALDINNDGWLDLYVVNWGVNEDVFCKANEIYMNDGDGTFTRVYNGAEGPTDDPVSSGRQGVTCADFDNDGDQDIYVCRRENNNWLFVNNGHGNFSDQAAARGVACSFNVRHHGASFVDIDNDADLDLFVMPYKIPEGDMPKLRVFINDGSGYFTDQTDSYNIEVSGYSMLFGDFDNDADQDMYLLRNDVQDPGTTPRLYLNDGNGNLTYTFMPGLESSSGDVRGGALADIDNDGDLDIYVACTRGDNNFMFRNDYSAINHYIQILCTGPDGDFGGFGSKVEVYQAGHLGQSGYLLGYQESVSNYAYLCQNQTALHFGLGPHNICSIRVTLTSGEVLSYTDVQADQVFEVRSQGNIENVRITDASPYNESGLTLTWDKVTGASGYQVYRDTIPNFGPDYAEHSNLIASYVSDHDGSTPGVQWTNTDQVLGDVNVNYYYIVTAIKAGVEVKESNVFGEFDYQLITTPTTDFNEIALPFNLPGVYTAQDLMNTIPFCNSIAKWDATIQGYNQYIPILPATNFTVKGGYPYFINVEQETLLTFTGTPAEPAFPLITTLTTDFNDLMLPLGKYGISNAQELMSDIPYCTSIARWVSAMQGFEQYIPIIPSTNFEIHVGYPYYVNITQDNIWPADVALDKTMIDGSPMSFKSVPHIVWGELPSNASGKVDVRLIINDSKLSLNSPGSGTSGKNWYIQLGALAQGWNAGDKAFVEFVSNSERIAQAEVVLTWDPADKAVDLAPVEKTVTGFQLNQNYPNPFNPETTIEFVLPEYGQTVLVITDITGRRVKTLVRGMLHAGFHRVMWDGENDQGKQAATGVYFYTLEYNDKKERKKLLLMR